MMPMPSQLGRSLAFVAILFGCSAEGLAEPPRPPASIEAEDTPWDGGKKIRITLERSADDGAKGSVGVTRYVIERTGEAGGVFSDEVFIDAKQDTEVRVVIDVENVSP